MKGRGGGEGGGRVGDGRTRWKGRVEIVLEMGGHSGGVEGEGGGTVECGGVEGERWKRRRGGWKGRRWVDEVEVEGKGGGTGSVER